VSIVKFVKAVVPSFLPGRLWSLVSIKTVANGSKEKKKNSYRHAPSNTSIFIVGVGQGEARP